MNGSEHSRQAADRVHEPLYSYAACRAIDQISQARGHGEIQLMGQAALASMYTLRGTDALETIRRGEGRLIVLCGPGNNGGDGYALLYHLAGDDARFLQSARVFQTTPPRSAPARFYASAVQELGVVFQPADEFLESECAGTDLIIEALLGTGQAGPPRDLTARIIARLVELRARSAPPGLIALDVPVGLTENDGGAFIAPGPDATRPGGATLPAPDEIHSYGVTKAALVLNPALAAYSRIRRLPMGFHPAALETARAERPRLARWKTVFRAEQFRKRPLDHKYASGHGVFVGGSSGMEGAAILGGATFFAAGGGILHLAVMNETARRTLTAAHPTFMVRVAGPGAFDLRPAAVLIGPGLAPVDLEGLRPTLIDWLRSLAGDDAGSGPFVILDAAATDLVLDPGYPDELRARTVLTPHTGEWMRLGGPAPGGHLAGLDAALRWCREVPRCFVLIKDAVSCLLMPEPDASGVDCLVHSAPLGALGVAGSGDVLGGILLARLARHDAGARAVDRIEDAVLLHASAATGAVHPRAEDFPDLIRARLSKEAD